MKIFSTAIGRGTLWTLGGYGFTQALRFVTNVIIARLLAPELFGIMVIVNTVRTGAELLSDMGISQSVVQRENGETPSFYNTAWTLQAIRGVILFLLCSLAAIPISSAYQIPSLAWILPASALAFLFSGFASMAPFILRRRLDLVRLNLFEMATAVVFSAFQIGIAYVYPTVWALVLGLNFGGLAALAGSFLLIPTMRHHFMLVKNHVREIVHFGKWVTISSAVYFITSSFDRLYLAGAVPLRVLGIYGIARTIAEIVTTLFSKLSNTILFPYIASQSGGQRSDLRARVGGHRLMFLLGTAACLAILASSADLFIALLFDKRYHSAGWMLSLLIAGSWFSILSALGEGTLLGLGKPQYGAAANGAKFVWLAASVPTGLASFGTLGAVVAVACSDLFRYAPLLSGQIKERFSFFRQDVAATLVLILVFAACFFLRDYFGFPLPI